jgi:hypothetical protein
VIRSGGGVTLVIDRGDAFPNATGACHDHGGAHRRISLMIATMIAVAVAMMAERRAIGKSPGMFKALPQKRGEPVKILCDV